MAQSREPVFEGGCQCGAVRYALYTRPTQAEICHCRMCQRAVGGPFFASATVSLDNFAWTTGTPSIYQSSGEAERTFCHTCGTPLSFRYLSSGGISLGIATLDDPEALPPTSQYAIETRLGWLDAAIAAPGVRLADEPPEVGAITSHQSPHGARP